MTYILAIWVCFALYRHVLADLGRSPQPMQQPSPVPQREPVSIMRRVEEAEWRRDISMERLESNQLSTGERKYFEGVFQNAEDEIDKWHRRLTETMRKKFSGHYGYEICGDHTWYDWMARADCFCTLPVSHAGEHHRVVDTRGSEMWETA